MNRPLLFLSLILCLSFYSAHSASSTSLNIKFNLEDFEISSDDGLVSISSCHNDGFYAIGNYPSLPIVTKSIVLPTGSKVSLLKKESMKNI